MEEAAVRWSTRGEAGVDHLPDGVVISTRICWHQSSRQALGSYQPSDRCGLKRCDSAEF